uniref:Uncharacterized protein n=1 Tax=Romanomermis culicivorax TaxID=13658 RepID=A0A915IHL6_ROMCU
MASITIHNLNEINKTSKLKALSYFAARYRAVPVVLFILTSGAARCLVILHGTAPLFYFWISLPPRGAARWLVILSRPVPRGAAFLLLDFALLKKCCRLDLEKDEVFVLFTIEDFIMRIATYSVVGEAFERITLKSTNLKFCTAIRLVFTNDDSFQMLRNEFLDYIVDQSCDRISFLQFSIENLSNIDINTSRSELYDN